MAVAIYARKSKEQHGADADARSVAWKVESARPFATGRGRAVDDAHVHVDDVVSGAEASRFLGRRMLDAIEARAPFQAIVMRDTSRFSRRDGDEAIGEFKHIVRSCVEVWFDETRAKFTFGTFAENVTGEYLSAETAAEHRRQIAAWTRAAMEKKARAGHVIDGRTFGYDNVPGLGAGGSGTIRPGA